MRKSKRVDPALLDELIDELIAQAGSDDEQIWNLRQALQKHIWLPSEGFVMVSGCLLSPSSTLETSVAR